MWKKDSRSIFQFISNNDPRGSGRGVNESLNFIKLIYKQIRGNIKVKSLFEPYRHQN